MKKSLQIILFVCCAIPVSAQITSTFDTDADGWTFYNNGNQTVNHNASNGNPGGFITTAPYNAIINNAQGWFAPAKFLGSQVVHSYGMNLRFDLQQSVAGTNSNGNGDVRITGQSIVIVFSLPVKPAVAPAWSSYSIPLDETGGWRIGNITGAFATKSQIAQALGDITSIQIRGTYATNASYISGLDNVVLEQRTLGVPPSPTSFTPSAGIPGTNVTITGNNFSATTSQNAVLFGTTKANIVSSTTTQLVVTVPKGSQYGPITVINLSTGLLTKTNQNFNPLFDNNKDFGGEIIPASLSRGLNTVVQNGTETTSGTNSSGGTMGAGDIDGDGWVDLVGSELGTGTIYVFRNLGTGGTVGVSSFATPASLSVSTVPLPGGPPTSMGEITITDVDSDGRLDITTIASNGVGHLVVYRNTSTAGSLSFASPEFFSYGYYSSQLRTISADFDGDGKIDFAYTTGTSPGGIWLNQNLSTPGNVMFAYAQYIGPNNGRSDLGVGDLNGDGKPELIATRGSFEIHENTSVPGIISFNTPFLLAGTSIVNFAVADLDADNKADLIWGGGAQVYFSKNIHSGGALSAASFDTPFQVPHLASNTYHIAVSDINGDGKPDVVATGDIDIAIFQNRSSPLSTTSFTNSTLFQASVGATSRIYPSAPVIADLDGDNKPEVMLSHTNYNIQAAAKGIYIFHNESFPVPVVNSMSPSSGNTSTNVTLTGDLMFTGNVPPTIRLEKINAVVNSPTNTSTATQVPAGAISGKFAVTNHGLTGYSPNFTVTFPTDRVINASSFGPSINFALANATRDALDVADLDDDGKPEVLVIDNFSTGKIFKNTHATAGQPITASSLTVESTTYGSGINLKALDIDGDGKIDLNSGFNLFQNTSSGSISFATGVTTRATNFNNAATADFNKDGKTDLALTDGTALIRVHSNQSSRGVYLPLGNHSTFSETVVNLAKVNGNIAGVVAADFDNDGYEDIIATNVTANSITIYKNERIPGPVTTASFSLVGNNAVTGFQPYNITANDFDGDGKIDLAVTYFNSAFISIYRNTGSAGTISFAAAVDVTCLNKGYSIASQDLDGDGKAEIVVIHQPNPGPGSFSVFKNTSTSGTVSFATPVNYALGRNPQALSIADINSDQKPDILIVASSGATAPANALMVFENKLSSFTITVNTQPTSSMVCNGTTTTFTTAATGTTNIAYQWQFSTTLAGTYTNINNGGGYSNATTASLSINTTGNFGAGFYRAAINGDLASTAYTNAVELVVNPIPSAPVIQPINAGCGPVSVTLTPTGATAGEQYRFYDVATGGNILSSGISFATPDLSTTTTYHISKYNTTTTCESARVPAIVNVETCNPPVVETSTTVAFLEGIVSIDLAALISDPDDNLDPTSIRIVTQPGSGAPASLNGFMLTVDYSGIPFPGTDLIEIEACDLTGICTQQELSIELGGEIEVFNAISPNGDGKNEILFIQYIDVLPDATHNTVSIFNRWGDLVFNVSNYNNSDRVFKGVSNNGKDLPAGIYYYKIEFTSGLKAQTGYLSLKR